MPQNYVPIFIILLNAFMIAAGALVLATFVRPSNPENVKEMADECGIEPVENARQWYTMRFYIVAILFVVFDMETVFLFPWAAQFKHLEPLGFWRCWSSSESWCSAIGGYGKGALEWI